MGRVSTLAVVSIMLLTVGCSDDSLELSANYPDELINTWAESYEEDYGVYRPSTQIKFPPSRFRQTYNFMENNQCEYLVLSPVDAYFMQTGQWDYDQEQKTICVYKENHEILRELKVKSLTAEKLLIGE